MEILVTGGLGYIGSHTVVSLIEQGYKPVIVDNLANTSRNVLDRITRITGEEVPYYEIDCANLTALREVFKQHHAISGAIHFAALKAVGESVEKPIDYYENNLGSLLTLLRCMVEFKTPYLVFSSSATVYGQPAKLPATEESPLQPPESPYGATKSIAELIIRDAVHAYPTLRTLALRYFNPIGAHPSGLLGELPQGVPNNLLPYVTQTAMGIRKELRIWGHDYNTPDRTALRDYFHVCDLARAHVLAFAAMRDGKIKEPLDFINIGAGDPVSVLEIVQTFQEVNGVKVPYILAERRAGDIEAIWADTEKAKKLLGWKPAYSLRDALLHAWSWEKHLSQERANHP